MGLPAAVVATTAAITLTMPHTYEPPKGPLGDWDGDDYAEMYSAVITARSCAQEMYDTGDLTLASRCSPIEGARTGFAVFDPVEEQIYLIDHASISMFELEHGFGGSIDLSGDIQGTVDGIPVIVPEDYSISPKPKPGAFKGCL